MFDFDKFKEDCGGFTNCLLCPFEKSCTDAFRDPENDDLPPCEKWDREKLLRRAIGSEPRIIGRGKYWTVRIDALTINTILFSEL